MARGAKAPASTPSADLGDVLRDELHAVQLRRDILSGKPATNLGPPPVPKAVSDPVAQREKIEAYNQDVDKLGQPLSALCLSGGGVRSAAFALGIVQGLAKKKILRQFDYLSTVSGGGYLGGFLTAWVQRAGYQNVLEELKTNTPRKPGTRSPLLHLRRYSSYLAPHKGLFTTDVVTVVCLYVRNLFLNWMIILPVVAGIILFFKVIALAFLFFTAGTPEQTAGAGGCPSAAPPALTTLGDDLSNINPIRPLSDNLRKSGDALRLALLPTPSCAPPARQWWQSLAAFPASETLAILLIGFAVFDTLCRRPGWESAKASRAKFKWREVLPMALGSIAASLAILKHAQIPLEEAWYYSYPVIFGVLVGALFLTAAIIAYFFAPAMNGPPTSGDISTRKTVRTPGMELNAIRTMITFTVSGVATGILLGLTVNMVHHYGLIGKQAFVWFCLGPPIVVGSFFLGELLHVGLSSYLPWSDAEREWLARAAGYHTRVTLLWMIVTGVVFGGSYVVFHLSMNPWSLGPFGLTGGIAGVIAALLGRASGTAATLREQYVTWTSWSAATILAIVTPIFVVVTASFLSAGIDLLLLAKPEQLLPPETRPQFATVFGRWFLLSMFLLVVTYVGSRFINVNRFSLYGIYRNRLIRAFLGASNGSSVKKEQRRADDFTGFDEKDNVNLSALWPNRIASDKQPPQFLVLNMALNIVATKELAWQERKALSFTASPRWIGCGSLGAQEYGCYRRTFEYAGGEPAKHDWDFQTGMTLGGAMTISGAAASPNMGYHSSPALSVLMTFFNVRLGAWLANPGPQGSGVYWREGPKLAAAPLIEEALGRTNDESKFVYLSDGGHFENLGLYEMIRRRCRLIVVSDAGYDPKAALDDLGNAVRKISIDLNVQIEFQSLTVAARANPPVDGTYCAVAKILYPDAEPGKLLYIKPSYHGKEPASVRSYAAENPAFPHEPTTDQWFGESQFEAYRELGEYIIKQIDGHPDATYEEIDHFIEAAATKLKSGGTRQTRARAKPQPLELKQLS